MSTRCNIIIKEKNEDPIYVYHHCDGYPEGVGAELKKILSTKYISNNLSVKNIEYFLYNYDNQYEETDGIHGDIEYLYILTVVDNNTINYKCIEVPIISDYNYITYENCELIEECDIHIINRNEEESLKTKPSIEQGISFIINNIYKEHMTKDETADMLKIFYDYLNTPFE